MKKIIILIGLLWNLDLFSQDVFFNNGQDIVFNTDVLFIVKNGNLINDAGNLHNEGLVVVEGDLVNNDKVNGGNSSSEFQIENNWENNGSFTANQSEVRLIGTIQKIAGISESNFYNLTLENGSVKTLENNASVSETLNVNTSELATTDFKFTVLNPNINSLQFIENSGFVSSSLLGRFVRNTNAINSYVFPTGENIGTLKYRPIRITPKSSKANQFEVCFVNSNADNDGYDFKQKTESLKDFNTNFYHLINQSIGNEIASVSLYYNPTIDEEWDGIAQWSSKWKSIGDINIVNTNTLVEMNSKKWLSNNNEPHVLVNVEECQIVVPTGFSPNGNNVNENFKALKTCDFQSFEMKVFDRWGSLIFTSTDVNNTWDGTYKGFDVDMGTYTWFVDYLLEDGSEVVQQKGAITLIK